MFSPGGAESCGRICAANLRSQTFLHLFPVRHVFGSGSVAAAGRRGQVPALTQAVESRFDGLQELCAQGVSEQAISVVRHVRRWWRTAMHPAIHNAPSTSYFDSSGVPMLAA